MTTRSQANPSNTKRDATPSQEARDAIRASVERFLARRPEHDEQGHERCVVEVHAAIETYLRPPSPEPRDGDASPEQDAGFAQLEQLAKHASTLTTTLDTLPAEARSRLTESARVHPDDLEAFERIGQRIASGARAASTKRDTGASDEAVPSRAPEFELIERLSVVWRRHTDERILRDREANSGWAHFVEVACRVAGIDRDKAHLLRVRAFDTAALDESAEILANIPDP